MRENTKSIDLLIEYCQGVSNLVHEFSQNEISNAKQGKKLTHIQQLCNDFLARTVVNVESLIPLLTIYKDKPYMIQPIALILRCSLSDFITFNYLLTFCIKDENEQVSLVNELHILEIPYFNALLDVVEIETNLHDYDENAATPAGDFATKEMELRQIFKHLHKQGNVSLRLKKAVELRETSDNRLFGPKERGDGFITESKKWDRMVRRGFKKHVLEYMAFKFFSQFQHYSKQSMPLLAKVSEKYLFFYLTVAIGAITGLVGSGFRLIDSPESDFINRLRVHENKLEKVVDSI